jgi:acyl-CoA synthetase (AMP-forming)/AMP-acid ligase II
MPIEHEAAMTLVEKIVARASGRASVSPGEIEAHCAANLAEYKRPRHIECRDRLPMSAVGKILYRVLRDELQQVTPGPGGAR